MLLLLNLKKKIFITFFKLKSNSHRIYSVKCTLNDLPSVYKVVQLSPLPKSEHFISSQRKPLSIKQSLPLPPSPNFWQSVCFLSLMICLFCIFKVHGFVQHWPCMWVSYTWCYVFETHLRFSTWFIPLFGLRISFLVHYNTHTHTHTHTQPSSFLFNCEKLTEYKIAIMAMLRVQSTSLRTVFVQRPSLPH